ncbi:MAG: TolC family protein [Verrucomicrobiota bacterium]|nr:TolC family protein [Verrucomicrobiota bacterium]
MRYYFKSTFNFLLGYFFLLFLFVGCKNIDSAKLRTDNNKVFQKKLEKQTRSYLGANNKLSLERCIDIALENNLTLKTAVISEKLAKLDRKAAFSHFLPNLQLQASSSATDRPFIMKSGGGDVQFSDQYLKKISLNIQQPIFMPQAWYIYAMRQKGEDLSRLLRERTEQMIRLQVISSYNYILSLKEMDYSYIEELKESKEILREVSALQKKGLALSSEVLKVEVLLLSRENNIKKNKRLQKLAKADLLRIMGLSPILSISLDSNQGKVLEFPTQEELIASALLNRKELFVQDLNIEIAKDQVKTAISSFLPNIGLIGGFSYNSDSYIKYADVWSYGVSGIMTVFNGFKNVNQYKSAKMRRKEAFLTQEDACMMIILEVYRAYQQLEEINENLLLAEKQLKAVEMEFSELKKQREKGIILFSAFCKISSKVAKASSLKTSLKYRQQIFSAVLLNVIGQK